MLGDEGDQQEEDCYHGDEDSSRDPQSVETRSYAKRRDSTHIMLPRGWPLQAASAAIIPSMCMLSVIYIYPLLYWNGQLGWTPALGLYTGMDN